MRRFSIRDLLWLTLVVGLALGWWVDRRRWAERLVAADWQSMLQEQRLREAQYTIVALQYEVSVGKAKLSQALQIMDLENRFSPNSP